MGEEKFDPEADKKPRAGQILWIRGLTRLQTQVSYKLDILYEKFKTIVLITFRIYYYTYMNTDIIFFILKFINDLL